MMKISIAMATFNGEKYLQEQLNSLASQKYLACELVICDDGSTDTTLELIANFAINSPFPVRVYRNQTNLGFAQNFLKAAQLCEGEWIAFCDQDDVWLPDKLDDVRIAVSQNSSIVLLLQKSYICNDDLTKSGRLFPDFIKSGCYERNSQFGFWVWLGCLQTFKKSILDNITTKYLPKKYYPGHEYMSHDKLTCLLANTIGNIVVLNKPALMYRRHENSLTGNHRKQKLTERIAKSFPVGENHYLFLRNVAAERKQFLNLMSKNVSKSLSAKFIDAAISFSCLEKIYYQRAELYGKSNILQRTVSFVNILALGGYFGPPTIALGWKSLLKDLLRVVGLIGVTAQVTHC